MNERIRELAEQARQYATTRHPISNIVLAVDSYVAEQKFAELIVRECISELSDTFDMTIEEGNHLKEHFGVEE